MHVLPFVLVSITSCACAYPYVTLTRLDLAHPLANLATSMQADTGEMMRFPYLRHRGEGSSETTGSHKTVNIFLGYFFMVNFCLGTGFLGVPFSFFYSGYLAAVPTLILAAFVTWLTSTWLLEVMARAQV